MSAVLITGCSGAGKSTIAAVLARRGLAAIDTDDDPVLARWVDLAGAVVVEEPPAPDLDWLSRHRWAWEDRLRASGAIRIDAAQPLDQVVDAILSHTRASPATSRPAAGQSRQGLGLMHDWPGALRPFPWHRS